MAVAFDASSLSASNNTSPLTWTHTPVGTPRGVTVAVSFVVSDGDVTAAITYGGVAMTAVQNQVSGPLGAVTDGRAVLYFLGSGIPTGAQTVSVTHNTQGNTVQASAVTVTAAADTEIGDSDFVVGDVANPRVTLTTAVTALRHGVIYSDADSHLDQVMLAGMTVLGTFDSGFRMMEHNRQTTASSGAFVFGYDSFLSTAYRVALVAGAVQEAAPPVPTAPSNLVATALSTTSIGLVWDDNSSDETSFRVERSPTGAGSWVTAGTPAANAEAFTDTGRTCETQYFYRVFAVNGSGDSTASNTDDATTLACPPSSGGGNRMGGTGAIRKPPRGR